jgi:hypothetical protein
MNMIVAALVARPGLQGNEGLRLGRKGTGIVQSGLDLFEQGVAREVPGFVLLDAIDQFEEFVY